jgi:hypothetical protein
MIVIDVSSKNLLKNYKTYFNLNFDKFGPLFRFVLLLIKLFVSIFVVFNLFKLFIVVFGSQLIFALLIPLINILFSRLSIVNFIPFWSRLLLTLLTQLTFKHEMSLFNPFELFRWLKLFFLR